MLYPVDRKNGWQMAEQVGYANSYSLQHLLGRAIWDEEQVWVVSQKEKEMVG
ncbi:MAG: hypothetical protein JO235_06405 [Chroococcidiopsidaceae cyanobacterium CP_BM_RX_35]|nr:hypothetical protein [Chroococcidiopsidaceae cyanobacterium CP_BM_RX_35]